MAFDGRFTTKVGLSRTDKTNMKTEITNDVVSRVGTGQPTLFLTTTEIAALTENKGLVVDTDGTKNIWYWDTNATPTAKYVDSGVLYSQTNIADDSVTTEKLVNKSVTNDKMADESITTSNIVDKNITPEKATFFNTTFANIAKDVTLEKGYLEYSDGSFVEDLVSGNLTTEYIELTQGVKYLIKGTYGTQTHPRVVWLYNAEKVGTRSLDIWYQNNGFKVAEGEKYIRVNLGSPNPKLIITTINLKENINYFNSNYLDNIPQNKINGFEAQGNLLKTSKLLPDKYAYVDASGVFKIDTNTDYNTWIVENNNYEKIVNKNMRFFTFLDDHKNVLKYIDNRDVDIIDVPINTDVIYISGQKYYQDYKFNYYICDEKNNKGGAGGTKYNPLGITLNTPIFKKLYAFKDEGLTIYYENLINALNIENYEFELARFTTDIITKFYKDKEVITFNNNNECAIQYHYYNNLFELLMARKELIQGINKKPIVSNMIMMGDSFVDGQDYLIPLKEMIAVNGGTLNTYGTRNGGTTEGYAGAKAKQFCEANQFSSTEVNPFWYGCFHFDLYMQNFGADYPTIDYVNINLGINDLVSCSKGIADTTLGYITTIVNSIHDYNPNIKIIINTVSLPSSVDGRLNYAPRNNMKKVIIEYNEKLIRKFEEVTNVIVNNNCLQIDPATMIRDDVHLTDEGWTILAKSVYVCMCKED